MFGDYKNKNDAQDLSNGNFCDNQGPSYHTLHAPQLTANWGWAWWT